MSLMFSMCVIAHQSIDVDREGTRGREQTRALHRCWMNCLFLVLVFTFQRDTTEWHAKVGLSLGK